MEKIEKHIGRQLKTLAGKFGPEAIIYATVTAINEDACTCDIITDDEKTITGVLLQSEEAASIDLLFIPEINSRVIIANLHNSADWCILKAGALAKIKITCNNIEFNGGTLGGLVKRDGAKAQLNKLEQDLNAIKTAFTSWVVVPNDGGAALKAAAASWAGSSLTETVNSDIENTAIKQ